MFFIYKLANFQLFYIRLFVRLSIDEAKIAGSCWHFGYSRFWTFIFVIKFSNNATTNKQATINNKKQLPLIIIIS